MPRTDPAGNDSGITNGAPAIALPADQPTEGVALTLADCLQMVLAHNENIQMRALEWLASQRRLKAAKGIFEPDFVSSVERNEDRRKNTAEQRFYLSLPLTDERNTLYNAGVEFLTPTGAKMRLGYSMTDLRNNFQLSGLREFQSFAGLSVTQPLLKNFGLDATMAGIRLAAGESTLAFQEYRRQLMIILSRAEAAYWDLYFAQELWRARSDSVHAAQTLLEDNRMRLQAGKGSELDVLQAEAGVSLRKARQTDAEQKRIEAMNRLAALVSGAGQYTNMQVRAADQPRINEAQLTYFDSMQAAFQKNPDYLSQRVQVTQENLRVAYAKNQRWPQLDLKGSYGLNGLGNTIGSSSDDIDSRGYPNWSVGVELRIPLLGGAKAKNEWEAARARKREALLGLKAAEVEIASAVDTAIRRIASMSGSVTNYLQVVDFNQRLLTTELARLDAGKTESRKVLEVEQDLSETKTVALENLVGYEKALIEWQLVTGTALEARQLELTQASLEAKTANLLRGGQWSDISYEQLRRQASNEYETRIKGKRKAVSTQ